MQRSFKVGDEVKFRHTSDETLDGAYGIVVGYFIDVVIVGFTTVPPKGYNPAVCISPNCLKLM